MGFLISSRLVALAIVVTPGAVAATCGPYASVSSQLGAKFGEEAHFSMLEDGGRALEFFGNPATGTWTLLEVTHGGACLIGAGHDWRPGRFVPGVPL